MREPQKGQIVQTDINGEDAWFTVMGTHNSGGLQVRLETTLYDLANEEFKIGDMFRVEKMKITKVLGDDCDDSSGDDKS